MKTINLTISCCGECPYRNETENGEYPSAGSHCENPALYDNIEKNGFKGFYDDDESFIPANYNHPEIDDDTYIHPNCPLPDVK